MSVASWGLRILTHAKGFLPVVSVAILLVLIAGGCTTEYAGDTPVVYMPLSTGTTITPTDSHPAGIDIYSETGIGEAIFWVVGSDTVDSLVLRLHLRGLEQLTFTYGGQTVKTAVSSHGDRYAQSTLISPEGEETPISPGSPYWLAITPVGDVDGMTAYFEVNLPVELHEGSGLFQLSWIDFYR